MKGYPNYFATKEDYENIMRDFPKWQGLVQKELKALQAIKDTKVTRAVAPIDPDDPESEWITEEIDNPLPIHKQKGFKTRKQLDDFIVEAEKKVVKGK